MTYGKYCDSWLLTFELDSPNAIDNSLGSFGLVFTWLPVFVTSLHQTEEISIFEGQKRLRLIMTNYSVIGPEPSYKEHFQTCFYGGPEYINFKDRAGRTALHTAVAGGRASIVEKLLRKGADPDIVDNEGYTALHLAVINCRIDIVRLLLRHGACCGVKSKSLSPFALAVKILSETSTEFVPLLMTNTPSMQKLRTTSSNQVIDDFSCPVVIVNNLNEFSDFTQDYFGKYVTRGLLHITFTLLYYGSEVWPDATSTGRCCHVMEKAVTAITQPQHNGCIYTDLLTLSVSIEKLIQNGCSLSEDFLTSIAKCRDYRDNESRERIVKLFCIILKGKAITELGSLICRNNDAEMLKLMLACGHRHRLQALHKDLLQEEDIARALRKPSSLTDLCRVNIRENLSSRKHGCSDENISRLPLPRQLKRFLTFAEWIDYRNNSFKSVEESLSIVNVN